jgi:hypothetical protein
MNRYQRLWGVLGLLLAIAAMVPASQLNAQESGSCAALVARAYAALSTSCATPARNEACLAGQPIAAAQDSKITRRDRQATNFDITTINTLQAAALDIEDQEWGVLAIGEGGSLPYNTEELVTMWLFGDATLTDVRTDAQRDASPGATCYATVTTPSLNIRSYPGLSGTAVGLLEQGDELIITGRVDDNTWWRIDAPELSQAAWIYSASARTNCPILEIPSVLRTAGRRAPSDWYQDPFQVIRLESALPDPDACPDAPPPGLLMQPPAYGRAPFTLNGITFDLTATIYIQANPVTGLLFQVIDAPLTLQFGVNTTVTVPPGAQYRFPLDKAGAINGPPQMEPLDATSLVPLPLDRLPHPVESPPAPVTPIPASEDTTEWTSTLDTPTLLYFDNRAGIGHEFDLSSSALPTLSIDAPDRAMVRPLIDQGQLSFAYWPVSDLPHYFTLTTAREGENQLDTRTIDARLCPPEGHNQQSQTLIGGEDHAGNIWFGQAGEVVTLRIEGDISTSASSFPDWRLRIAEMYIPNDILPPAYDKPLEGHNLNEITWEVPATGYYWIEVWTEASGTTTVFSQCEQAEP